MANVVLSYPHRTADGSVAACPRCGGALEVVTEGAIGEEVMPGFAIEGRLEFRVGPAAFVACSACEFCARLGRRS